MVKYAMEARKCDYYPGLQSSVKEGLQVGIAAAAPSRLRLYKVQHVNPTNAGQE